ncbi:purine/pyrimidine permease [Sediminibacillus albus]|uniref:Xanthine/uracil permease n=1 Tax=Sediminibacillus albus TaxID=407036 RepID=A0A1G8ZVN7_9BACI|nr:purine/pyrimidine permease [Sediminibacillus albus]SDK19051.1 Xanthine/uracil permease [Sediminibacillus albus]
MVYSKMAISKTGLETLQWFIFLLASSVALPIVIGSLYEMDFTEVAGLMQRTFFIVGVASLLQGLVGHRLPIMEGPAGLWISIFSVMAVTGAQQGMNAGQTLQSVETAMLFTGGFLILFGAFRLAEKLLPLFTPLVTGSFLFLLTVQLSGTFLKGMLGIQQKIEAIHGTEAIIAFITFFIVLGLSIFARGWLGNYAVLIGIVIGWVSYGIFVGNTPLETTNMTRFALPEWFAWGAPRMDWSVVPIAFITAVILLSNVVASVVATSQSVYGKASYSSKQINRGSAILGVNHGLVGVFSAIANVPLATSAGFIKMTGQTRKQPFLFASGLLILVAFFPPIVAWISGIPAPIANAAILATFVQLMGLGLSNIASEQLDSRRLTIIGVSYLFGIGSMFLPMEVFAELPLLIQNLASNGLLVGTILVIVLEQCWRQDRPEVSSTTNKE